MKPSKNVETADIVFSIRQEPTIKTLSDLCEIAKSGASEIELIASLASLTLAPMLSVEEIMQLPASRYKEVRELTASFQLYIQNALQ
jgi:hypothetical protein